MILFWKIAGINFEGWGVTRWAGRGKNDFLHAEGNSSTIQEIASQYASSLNTGPKLKVKVHYQVALVQRKLVLGTRSSILCSSLRWRPSSWFQEQWNGSYCHISLRAHSLSVSSCLTKSHLLMHSTASSCNHSQAKVKVPFGTQLWSRCDKACPVQPMGFSLHRLNTGA